MKFVEWPGHQGSRFRADQVAGVILRQPQDGDTECHYSAAVFLKSGHQATPERGSYELVRNAIQAFCERVEEALCIAAGPPIRRCTECGRSLPPDQLANATCDPAGRLTCSDCERAHVERVQAALRMKRDTEGRPTVFAFHGLPVYGPGPTPCDPGADNPEPPYDPFPDERGEQE